MDAFQQLCGSIGRSFELWNRLWGSIVEYICIGTVRRRSDYRNGPYTIRVTERGAQDVSSASRILAQ